MRKQGWAALMALMIASTARAAEGEFTSEKQCIVGAEVTDRKGRTGTVVSVERGFCRVRFADGTTTPHIFWMLRAAGADSKPHLKKGAIPPGLYRCNRFGIDLHIDDADHYRDGRGTRGRYRLVDDGTIQFGSGSFLDTPGEWLQERKIGLSIGTRGNYNVLCERT
jgi:hypothetical protein